MANRERRRRGEERVSEALAAERAGRPVEPLLAAWARLYVAWERAHRAMLEAGRVVDEERRRVCALDDAELAEYLRPD